MNPVSRLTPWTSRTLFLAVVALPLLVRLIESRWFRRSASGELDALATPSGADETTVGTVLQRLWAASGPREGSPRLLSWASYAIPDQLERAVTDEGRGIAPKEAKKVFEPFYREQVSRNTQEMGSGVGLFLARRQARRMGGTLKRESPWRRPGLRQPGCRFVLTVPCHVG